MAKKPRSDSFFILGKEVVNKKVNQKLQIIANAPNEIWPFSEVGDCGINAPSS